MLKGLARVYLDLNYQVRLMGEAIFGMFLLSIFFCIIIGISLCASTSTFLGSDKTTIQPRS
jgi:hypothetical protein